MTSPLQYHRSNSHNNNYNNNNNNNNNNRARDPTIRHSGRAHIRGQIRRIWRPRFLEVCDTGLVRYYELPPTADVTLPDDSDFLHINMMPKDTLIIFHARIIDVTTLRDLHVGLPKGSFGFLFRGQRQLHLELQQANEPNPPREYFCAVSTLEEAQTWVIVLQWAAATAQRLGTGSHSGSLLTASGMSSSSSAHHGGTSSPPTSMGCSVDLRRRSDVVTSGVATGTSGSGKASILRSPTAASPTAGMSLDRNPTASHDSVEDEDDPSTVLVDEPPTFPFPPSPQSASLPPTPSAHTPTTGTGTSSSAPRSPGRIVVTKVHGCRLVPTQRCSLLGLHLEWEIAYDIALLLLQPPMVEERRILRTKSQLQQWLVRLADELDSRISLSLVEEWQPRLDASLPSLVSTSTSPNRLPDSFRFLDQLLRALAMDANIVNSHAMKTTFVLDTEAPPIVPARPWRRPPPDTMTHRRIMTIAQEELDTFVKTWLAMYPPRPPTAWESAEFWMLQRPWLVLAGFGLGLALSIPLGHLYPDMLLVTIRLDVLFFSWCLAAFLGKELSSSSSVLSSSSSRASRERMPQPPSKAARTAASASVAAASAASSSSPHQGDGAVLVTTPEEKDFLDASSVDSKEDMDYLVGSEEPQHSMVLDASSKLSSPLPKFPNNQGQSCWSIPPDVSIFRVRGPNYLEDRIKMPSGPAPLVCRGVDVWLTDNPERHIARHPSVLNGKLGQEDTFLVNFLLPFGNFVSYFAVPPLSSFPPKLADVWTKFLQGDQQYRDKRLKLLPVVMDGPWIVKAAVGNGTAPALLGKVIPLQYFFREPDPDKKTKGVYEVDVIITASSIAKGILSVVKGHTKSLTIAFAFIIEAAYQEELPETVLCSFQVHALHLEDCPQLPECNLDELENTTPDSL